MRCVIAMDTYGEDLKLFRRLSKEARRSGMPKGVITLYAYIMWLESASLERLKIIAKARRKRKWRRLTRIK